MIWFLHEKQSFWERLVTHIDHVFNNEKEKNWLDQSLATIVYRLPGWDVETILPNRSINQTHLRSAILSEEYNFGEFPAEQKKEKHVDFD